MSGVYPEAGGVTEFTGVRALPNNGGIQMNMQVNPGWPYIILVSTDLINWSQLTTFTSSSSLATYIDPSPNYTARFFRLVTQ